MAAFELGPPHAGANSLDDQVALEFGDGPDDDHNGPAQGTSSVDLFTEADELDVQPVQFVEYIEEVFYRRGDTIGSADQDNVETAAASVAHHGIETSSMRRSRW